MIPSLACQVFEPGDIVIHIFSLHFDPSLEDSLGMFLFQHISEISPECPLDGVPQVLVRWVYTIVGDFIHKPPMLQEDPFINMRPLQVCKEKHSSGESVGHREIVEVDPNE